MTRRPSAASVTTVSSIGSKSSLGRGFHKKKLDAFFGEEFPRGRGSVEAELGFIVTSLAPYLLGETMGASQM